MSESTTRRKFLKQAGSIGALGLAALTLPEFLAACANAGQATTAPSSGASAGAATSGVAGASQAAPAADLTMWWWGEQEAKGLQKYVDDSAAKYAATHPGSTLQAVLQADESLIPAFTSACSAKSGPDIQYQWGGSYTMGFVWQDCVAPISDLLSSDELGHIFKGNLQETAFNGKVYGLPWYTVPLTIFYSKPAFKAAGLDPENPPQTWDDFTAAIPKLRSAGYIPWGYGVQGLSGIGVFAGLFILQDLDRSTDILKPAIGQASFTDPKYAGWLSRIEQLISLNTFNDDVTSMKYFDSQNLLVAGKAAMAVGVETMIPDLVSKLGADNLGVMAPPKSGAGALAGALPTTSQQLFVTGFSQNQKAAADVLAFLHSSERLQAMYQASGAISPDDRFDPSVLKTDAEKRIFALQKASNATHYQNYWPAQMDRENLFLGVQALFAKQQTAAEAAAAIDGRLKTWRDAHPDDVKNLSAWVAGA